MNFFNQAFCSLLLQLLSCGGPGCPSPVSLQNLNRCIRSLPLPGGLPAIAQLQPRVVLTLGLHPQGLLLAAVLGVGFLFMKLLVAS